jgi:DNA-binding MarR family transcriptional regulator
VDEPRWLDETERRAWLGLISIVLVGMPELERTFRPHGLVHVEFGLLAALSDNPDGLRMSALAELMNMSASRISHRMRKLVDRGYVEISGSDADGRVAIARITETGRRFAAQVAPAHVADVRRLIFDHLDREQVAALADALSTVAEKIGACTTGPLGKPTPQ